MKRATIQDVARSAEVSVTSVSNFLNGQHNHLRPETIERIRKSIEKLNYSPSKVARQLKTGHAPMLGVLTPTIVNPYHGELALAIDEAARRRGFRAVLGNSHRDEQREISFIEELVDYGVRGIIVTTELTNQRIMMYFVKRGIAFVLFDLRASEAGIKGIDVVSIDNVLATSIAVDHLVSLGHRRIAYVTPTRLSASRRARLQGFESAIRRHGLGEPIVISKDSDPLADQGDSKLAYFGQRAAEQLLRIKPRPTAVVTMNDILAIGVLAGLHKQGIGVPDDMSLVGIDDIQISGLIVPTMTTLRPNYQKMAENAVNCLISRLATPTRADRECIFAPDLIERESSTPPATAKRSRSVRV
ncbi:LacI family DNA-binding transcriptional regulator [Propionivibrio sp.]|uniref:LacI family DNA-binding transcriptional regulator n=1 Tax=Propionivibrio sp. TaxID=2212460 RepID=UPI0039E4D748